MLHEERGLMRRDAHVWFLAGLAWSGVSILLIWSLAYAVGAAWSMGWGLACPASTPLVIVLVWRWQHQERVLDNERRSHEQRCRWASTRGASQRRTVVKRSYAHGVV
jgi:hypothetical protein